ncbi:MAG: cytidine deaminase [Syntrophomonadaceae bacterium]|nr:cytidine deaminase [Syntrophomonadaceae bacterium]MDD3023180.1 cytidine deaminase [Syntrophomonadaceae bacterium]
MDKLDLITMAREAQKQAYAPYSEFLVGAVLVTKSGKIYTGANIENSSYGLSICAERVAVFKAVNAGEHDFETIIICSSGKGFIYPCGACLQVLAEFSKDITVIITDEKNQHKEYNLNEMLPQVFSLGK